MVFDLPSPDTRVLFIAFAIWRRENPSGCPALLQHHEAGNLLPQPQPALASGGAAQDLGAWSSSCWERDFGGAVHAVGGLDGRGNVEKQVKNWPGVI